MAAFSQRRHFNSGRFQEQQSFVPATGVPPGEGGNIAKMNEAWLLRALRRGSFCSQAESRSWRRDRPAISKGWRAASTLLGQGGGKFSEEAALRTLIST